MANQVQPIFIFPEGTMRTTGRTAQRNNIMAAKQVAETVRTTLGPKGMDKMIVDSMGDIIVTNDGVTILQEMTIEHPAAKMVVEIAKTQESSVGDGTTTAVVFAGELLKNAEDLLEKEIHPTIIARGYRMAAEHAIEVLHKIAEPVTEKDTALLTKIALTAMTGKGAEASKELLSEIAVRAVRQIMEIDAKGKPFIERDYIKIEKKVGGSLEESELVQGLIIDKEKVHTAMPRQVVNAQIALLDCAIEIKSTETDAKIQISDPSQMQAFLDQEERMIQTMVKKIVETGATALFCQKGIDDYAQHLLAKSGIVAVRRIKKSDMDALSRATGARVVSKISDLSKQDIGKAGLVEEVRVGDENMVYVKECKNPKAVTILIRGASDHVIDEVKRAMEDAIGDITATIAMGKAVAGGGAAEMEVAKALHDYATKLSGREQLAVQAFASALEVIPRTLAENAGLDPIDTLTALKNAHDKGQKWGGLDVFTGKVVDSWKAGVIEPLKIKTQAVSSASEVAVMILRIDDVISGAPVDKGGQAPPGAGNDGMGMEM